MSGFVIFALILTFVYVVYFAVMITLDLHGKKDAIEERNEGPDEGDMTFTEQITDDGLRVVNPTGNVPYPQPPSGEEQSQQPQSHTVTSEELNEKNDEILEHIDPVPQCSYLSDEFMQNLNNKHNTRKIEKKNARDKL